MIRGIALRGSSFDPGAYHVATQSSSSKAMLQRNFGRSVRRRSPGGFVSAFKREVATAGA